MGNRMKISFENNQTEKTGSKTENERIPRKHASRARAGISAYQVELGQGMGETWEVGRTRKGQKGKSLEEVQQEASSKDAAVLQDYMTVMSHTASSADYARMEEEGFSMEDMEPQEAVNILDKIKAQLALSGQEIIGYTDEIDMETLTEAVGSPDLARAITKSFRDADIPLTMENIEKAVQASEMASGLETPGQGEYRYMVDNEMDASIRDFYMAENSGAAQEGAGVPEYYADDVQGYYSRKADYGQADHLGEQVDKVIRQAGLEVNQSSREGAAWLLDQGLPLTAENLKRLDSLKSVAFPVSQEQAVSSAAEAIAQGREAMDGYLDEREDVFSHGARIAEYYMSDENFTGMQLANRRLLEEIRLHMTAEVNVKLIRSGFAIDTAPMEQLIEALTQAEKEIAEQYFPGAGDAAAKYRQYNQTCEIVKEIPFLPSDLLGRISAQPDAIPLEEFYARGKQLQETYKEAGEHYETMMTSPRRDMGDSIQKAFANVDDILSDLGWDCTAENRKAARILGYNNMEITPENLSRVKSADSQVQKIVERMTPAATLKMIRDGVNPLDTSLEDLGAYFEEQPSFEEQARSYSKFLHGLEKNGEVTQGERDAYIGIYRLLHQIERSDGAVVGSLVNAQAELNFSNLLSAVRSSRAKRTDIKVTDAVGTLTGLEQKGVSISDQIAGGYREAWKEVVTEASYSEEGESDYYKQNLEMIRQSVSSEQECMAMLQKGNIPVTAHNILAVQAMQGPKGGPFRRFLDHKPENEQELQSDSGDMTTASGKGNPEKIWELLDRKEDFQNTYREIVGELEESVREETLQDAETSIDVRNLQMVHKQLCIAGSLAEQEEYHIPVYIGDELTNVHVTLQQGKDAKGQVKVSLHRDGIGDLEGHFQMKDGRVSGYFTGSTKEAVTELRRAADIFDNEKESSWDTGEIPVFLGSPAEKEAAAEHKSPEKASVEVREAVSNEQLYHVAKRFLTAVKNSAL